MLCKIHKQNNPRRLIVNVIGTVTEKITAHVDEYLRKCIPRIPSYINDITHSLNIIKQIKLDPQDILVTIDVSSLYTNIPHNEGISALTRMIDEVCKSMKS